MSDNVLARILESKRREVEAARAALPLPALERQARVASPPRGFAKAIQSCVYGGRPAVIAEIKRASPSQGAIRPQVDVAAVAQAYAASGACCLSVLTDGPFFGGSRGDLETARAACSLPVIRKDFIVDPYQVVEARAWGADCILLIVDAVPDEQLAQLEGLARDFGMDVLVESHDAGQLRRALKLRTSLVGINNRDLRSFVTRLETTATLAPMVPPGRVVVAESGITKPGDIRYLQENGVSAYLIGGSLMAAPDPGRALRELLAG